jgi:hypothetical protein
LSFAQQKDDGQTDDSIGAHTGGPIRGARQINGISKEIKSTEAGFLKQRVRELHIRNHKS